MSDEEVMREHARRIAHLPEEKIGKIIVTSYDDGPDRDAMRRYVFEAQDDAKAAPSAPSRVTTEGPIATPEQAIAAYAEQGSDRKAAKALGISRTQVRRLRGLEK